MTLLLSGLLIGVLVTANVSKWYLDLGPRLNFYVIPLVIFTAIVLLDALRRPMVVPKRIKMLAAFKAIFVLTIPLTLPVVVLESRVSLALVAKGFTIELINALGIIAVMFFLTRLDSVGRRRLVDWYFIAIAICAAFTVAEAVAAYGFSTDLDRTLTDYLPFWSLDAPSINKDVWGVAGETFYRLNGLAGEPNLNAVIFMLALPFLYLRLKERFSPQLIVLLFVSLAIIAQSLSNTAIPLTVIMLVTLNFRQLQRAKVTVAITLAALAFGAVYLWAYQQPLVEEVLGAKLDPFGTRASHIEIAVAAIDLWRAHPLGLGINAFAVYSPYYSAHNSYLQTLVELGPVSLLVLVAESIVLARVAMQTRNPMGFASFLASIALILSSFGHDLLRRVELQLPIHMFVACAVLDARERLLAVRRPAGIWQATLETAAMQIVPKQVY